MEWEHLKAKVEEYSSECDTKQEAMLWLDALWVKREKWIAQCTWQHCTWGIHSTQRAEATQASVKRARLANASISKLTGALIELNTKRRQKQDVDDIRATVRHAAGTEYQSALLVDLRARLTPFAFELCAAQMKLALSYTCTESTAGTYLVTYGGAAPVTSNTPVMNELGEITSFECNTDFGLGTFDEEERAGRLTSMTDCSCLFPRCFRLPCRHILYCHINQQQQKLQMALGDKWLIRSTEQSRGNLFRLRAAPAPKPTNVPRATTLSQRDRRAILHDELSSLLDAASGSNESFELFKSCLPALHYAIEHKTTLPIPHVRQGDQQGDQVQQATGDQPTSIAERHRQAIVSLIGTNWKIDTTVIDAHTIASGGLVGQSIAYHMSSSSWWVGQVRVMDGDEEVERGDDDNYETSEHNDDDTSRRRDIR